MSSQALDSPAVTTGGYQPPGWLQNPHLQSILASSSARRHWIATRMPGMQAASRRITLDCGDGVRLYAHVSPQPGEAPGRGQVVLIHGWEGCHDSVYLFSMASRLWEAGYAIVRLNLRDHGYSHHLNVEPFVSTRLSDTVGALRDIARRQVNASVARAWPESAVPHDPALRRIRHRIIGQGRRESDGDRPGRPSSRNPP